MEGVSLHYLCFELGLSLVFASYRVTANEVCPVFPSIALELGQTTAKSTKAYEQYENF